MEQLSYLVLVVYKVAGSLKKIWSADVYSYSSGGFLGCLCLVK